MEETRKYKQTELGLLPEDWEVVKLGEIGYFLKGNGISKSQANSGDLCAVRYGELYTLHHNYIKTYNSHISKEVALFATKIQKGDILFACSGETKEEIGKCAAFVDEVEAYAGGDILILRTDQEKCSDIFLGFLLNMPIAANQKAAKGQGDAVVHISKASLENLSIPLPPIEEQRRIASALTSIDNLIDSLDRLIAKKRDIKQGAMQQLLSGKKRVKGFIDKWETLLFKDVFKFLTTNTFARELLNIKGEIKNIHYGDILTNYCEVLDVSKTDLPYIDNNKVTRYNPVILAKDGDIIIADTAEDETVCKATEIYNIGYAKVVSGLHTMWCRPKNNIFAPKFLGYFINSSMFHNQIIPLIQGIKVSSVSKNAIKDTWISFPTLPEQQAIASVLTSMDNELSALEAKRKKYEQIKQGMMRQLLTGRIRLN